MRRLLRSARAAYGIVLLVLPARVIGILGGDPADAVAVVAARALGTRHVLQALAEGSEPGKVRRLGGAAVDALHAGSMFALAMTDGTTARHRPALADGSVAAAFCLAGLVARPRR
jgi:hypothetical protein